MTIRYFLIVSIFCLSALASGSLFEPPHLEVTLHDVYPSPICTLGSRTQSEDSVSTLTLILEGVGDPVPVEVVFSIDHSGSMLENDSNNKRLIATKKLVSHLDPSRDKAGLVIWNGTVIKSGLIKLTNKFDELNDVLELHESDIPARGKTDYDSALRESINLFNTSDENIKRCVIFLSDGVPTAYTPPGDPNSQIARAREKGIEIWTVGYTIGQEGEMILSEIANNTNAKYYKANNTDIETVFIEIYKNMTSLAGKNITVEYQAPADLLYSIDYDHVEVANKNFVRV